MPATMAAMITIAPKTKGTHDEPSFFFELDDVVLLGALVLAAAVVSVLVADELSLQLQVYIPRSHLASLGQQHE